MNGAVFHSLLSLVSFEEIGGDKQWTRRGGQGSFIVSWPSLFLSRLSISEIWSILELKERFLKTDPFSLRTCTCINTPNKTNNKLKMLLIESYLPTCLMILNAVIIELVIVNTTCAFKYW